MASNDPRHREKAPHILNTSANLLGLCFIVLTSLKAMRLSDTTIIDEFTAACLLLFMVSSIFSFLSLRAVDDRRSARFELIADYIFMTGLFSLFITTLLVTFDLIL